MDNAKDVAAMDYAEKLERILRNILSARAACASLLASDFPDSERIIFLRNFYHSPAFGDAKGFLDMKQRFALIGSDEPKQVLCELMTNVYGVTAPKKKTNMEDYVELMAEQKAIGNLLLKMKHEKIREQKSGSIDTALPKKRAYAKKLQDSWFKTNLSRAYQAWADTVGK